MEIQFWQSQSTYQRCQQQKNTFHDKSDIFPLVTTNPHQASVINKIGLKYLSSKLKYMSEFLKSDL